MKAVAVIPARGGSVGVPRKNLRTVGGDPLVVRTVRAALAAETVGRVIVSTDDPEIAAVVRRAGADVHERGLIHSGPDATVSQVVALVIENLSVTGPVVVLQPTSPFTDAPLVDAVAAMLADADSVETVHAWRHGLFGPEGGTLQKKAANRQAAPVTAWMPTGAVRAMRTFPAHGGPLTGHPMIGETHVLFDPSVDLGCSEEKAERYALDVDTPADFAVARDLASRGYITFVVTAGHDTGSGHLHRCLTLADELAHHNVKFQHIDVEWPGWAAEMVEARGHLVDRRGKMGAPSVTVYDCLERPSLSDIRAIQSGGGRIVVLECLDPQVVAAADLAVNSLYTGPPGALCGPHWEPLRPEFAIPPPVPQLRTEVIPGDEYGPAVTRVLITFGGTDPSHLTERYALWAADASPAPTEVRVLWPPGRVRPSPPDLTPPGGEWTMAESTQAWPLTYWEGGSVSDALDWADVVVTSGGRTVLEAAAMRRPAVVVCAHEREEHHAPVPGMVWLGHHSTVTDLQFQGAVRWLIEHPHERAARGDRAFAAVDPSGAAVQLAEMIDGMVRG